MSILLFVDEYELILDLVAGSGVEVVSVSVTFPDGVTVTLT